MAETLLNVNTDYVSTGVLAAGNTMAIANVKPCTYNNVRVDAQVAFNTTGTSVAQDVVVTLKWTPITLATPVTLNTWTFHSLAEVRKIPLSLVYIGDVVNGGNITCGGALSLICSGGSNDSQTTFVVTAFYVTGVE